MRTPFSILIAVAIFALGACTPDPDPAPTTDVAPLASLELAVDGIGDVLFGLDPDTVVADVSARFGSPDLDSGWIPAEPNIFGNCPGEQMRAIGWGSLVAIFIDDGTSDLGGFFYTYTYGYDYAENAGGFDPRGLALTTAGGVGLGTSVATAKTEFNDLTISGDADLDVWSFESASAGFRGLVTGPDSNDTITLIEPRDGCS